MKLSNLFLAATLALSLAPSVNAEPVGVDSLLNLVEQGQARDDKAFKARLNEFNQSRAQQEKMLADAKAERTRLEKKPRSRMLKSV